MAFLWVSRSFNFVSWKGAPPNHLSIYMDSELVTLQMATAHHSNGSKTFTDLDWGCLFNPRKKGHFVVNVNFNILKKSLTSDAYSKLGYKLELKWRKSDNRSKRRIHVDGAGSKHRSNAECIKAYFKSLEGKKWLWSHSYGWQNIKMDLQKWDAALRASASDWLCENSNELTGST
jgi:hypothetical protein